MFDNIFHKYPKSQAPFMHQLLQEWGVSKPLSGLRVLHNVPLVQNTLLKISCLQAAGADITVTNPNFMLHDPAAAHILAQEHIPFVTDIKQLKNESFDLIFDTGAEMYQLVRTPSIGVIELTGSGDNFFQNHSLDCPVISIDQSYTKQIETVLGVAKNFPLALSKLIREEISEKPWVVFGFGKIGHGIAYACQQNNISLTVIEKDSEVIAQAEKLNITAIHYQNSQKIQSVLQDASLIIAATGVKDALAIYPKDWFKSSYLANMGIYDEYGSSYAVDEVLNDKNPVNFSLDDPTPIECIDPEFYAHNVASLELLNSPATGTLMELPKHLDQKIVQQWCAWHHYDFEDIKRWFVDI